VVGGVSAGVAVVVPAAVAACGVVVVVAAVVLIAGVVSLGVVVVAVDDVVAAAGDSCFKPVTVTTGFGPVRRALTCAGVFVERPACMALATEAFV
jgi:hypothetical protein